MIALTQLEHFIYISGKSQTLLYKRPNQILKFHISTAANGFGETENSFKTPRGWHYIRCIIGKDHPSNTYYSSRRPVHHSDISGRILWLHGIESNNKNSLKRYIYIHGTPQPFSKKPSSKGCINMHNKDINTLCQLITPYTKVYIDEN